MQLTLRLRQYHQRRHTGQHTRRLAHRGGVRADSPTCQRGQTRARLSLSSLQTAEGSTPSNSAGCSQTVPGSNPHKTRPRLLLCFGQHSNGTAPSSGNAGGKKKKKKTTNLDRHTGFCQAAANISLFGRRWVLYRVIDVSANRRPRYFPRGSPGGVAEESGEETRAWPKCVGILQNRRHLGSKLGSGSCT